MGELKHVPGLWQEEDDPAGPLWRQPEYVKPAAPLEQLRRRRYGGDPWQRALLRTVEVGTISLADGDTTDVSEGMVPMGWGVANAWSKFSERHRYGRPSALRDAVLQ